MNSFIKNKILFEYKKGQLMALGYGDIINSDADIIVVSAFDIPSFVSNSSIGALREFVFEKTNIDLEELLDSSFSERGFQLFDLSASQLPFKKILLVCMGARADFKAYKENSANLAEIVVNRLKTNLQKCISVLLKERDALTLDVTALGTRYGGVHRKESFDMLINWTTDLLNTSKNLNLVRLVAFDLDTFVDFFESIYRFKIFKPENELSFHADYDIEKYPGFKTEISAALNSLDQNPRNVIITCRTIIESIVKGRLNIVQIRLVDGINLLKDKIPPNIFSYLTTCRILGNFSNHDPGFIPTRRDAEGILLLTLRVVEWHLAAENGNQ